MCVIGTGTVLFCDSHSYMRAVAAGAIDIKCDCFHKLVSGFDVRMRVVDVRYDLFSLTLIHSYVKMNRVHFVHRLLTCFVETFIVFDRTANNAG